MIAPQHSIKGCTSIRPYMGQSRLKNTISGKSNIPFRNRDKNNACFAPPIP